MVWTTNTELVDGKQDCMTDLREMDAGAARIAPPEQFALLIHHKNEEVLRGLLENSYFEEVHLCLLLGRKDLSSGLLETISTHTKLLRSYQVRRALAFHPHVPQALGMQLVRELYATDLVQLTLSSSSQPAVRHLAEELILSRLSHLPPAQKMLLARRGSPRLVGALLIDGGTDALAIVLDSPLLNEGHVLRALARIALPARTVCEIAEHARWSSIYSVRLALLRNAQSPLARVLTFLPTMSVTDLKALSQQGATPARVQPHIRRELANRMQHGKGASAHH
jgi:hypothetical protein